MIECANKDNLVRCTRCSAIYDKTLRWVKGFYDNGTADQFTPYAQIEENCCPICNKERE